jgi:hypothetical protein
MKEFVRLLFHTTWHSFYRHCTIGGSDPVASPGGRFRMQLGSSWSRLHRSVEEQSMDAFSITEKWLENHKLACDVERTVTQLANRGVNPDPGIVHRSPRFTQQFRATGDQGHELN